jgi:hypothetical protein
MKLNKNVKRRLAAGLILWLGASGTILAAESAKPPMVGTNEQGISLSIRCTNAVVKVGDEISIEFLITNHGTDDYKYANRTYDRGGRMSEYTLIARIESGDLVPDPRGAQPNTWMMGGLHSPYALHPGESATRVIPLNLWALIKDPGRYAVVGTYLGEPFRDPPDQAVSSEPITLDIQPRTAEEMDAYISALANQIAAIPPARFVTSTKMPENVLVTNSVYDSRLDRLAERLAYTCSPKVVPILLDAMYKPASGGFWEAEALLAYVPRSEETKRAIIATARDRGLAGGMEYVLSNYGCTEKEMRASIERSLQPDSPRTWSAGARAAQSHPNDAFTPRLIVLASDNRLDENARIQAAYALAANRTDESVKALKSLLDDPDKRIRSGVKQAINTAYNYRGRWTGTPLKPDDFDKALRHSEQP